MNEHVFGQQPVLKFTGLNYWRYLAIFGLLMASLASFLFYKYVGFVVVLLGLYCISMILFIKFPIILIYDNYLSIIHKGIFDLFSEKKELRFDSLKQIEYLESNKIPKFRLMFYSIKFFGFDATYPDDLDIIESSIIVVKTDKDKIVIRKFGNESAFKRLFEVMKSKIKMPCN